MSSSFWSQAKIAAAATIAFKTAFVWAQNSSKAASSSNTGTTAAVIVGAIAIIGFLRWACGTQRSTGVDRHHAQQTEFGYALLEAEKNYGSMNTQRPMA